MKTPYASDTGFGKIELEMAWNSVSWRLALIVSDGAIQTAKSEKQSIDLLSCEAYKPEQNTMTRYTEGCSSGHYYLGGNQANWT